MALFFATEYFPNKKSAVPKAPKVYHFSFYILYNIETKVHATVFCCSYKQYKGLLLVYGMGFGSVLAWREKKIFFLLGVKL